MEFNLASLEAAISEAGMTPYALAKGAGLSTATVHDVLHGAYIPKPKTVKKMADFLKKDVLFFYDTGFRKSERTSA